MLAFGDAQYEGVTEEWIDDPNADVEEEVTTEEVHTEEVSEETEVDSNEQPAELKRK